MGLFAKDKPSTAPAAADQRDLETSIFVSNLAVNGKVSGGGNLIVMGNLEGEFDLNGELVVAASALVNGEAKAVRVAEAGRRAARASAPPAGRDAGAGAGRR